MLFLEDYNYVRKNIDVSSIKLAKELNISTLMVNFYKEHERLSPVLWKEKQLFAGDTKSLKPTKTFPELYVNKDGLLAIKHKGVLYAQTFFIWNRRRSAGAKVKQVPSINLAGKRFMLKKLVAESIGLNISDGIMVKDGNELNIRPDNLTTRAIWLKESSKFCLICGKKLSNKRVNLCTSCLKKHEKIEDRKKMAKHIEKLLNDNRIGITIRQEEVLSLYKKGLSISNIAKTLNTSRQNISDTIKAIKRKVNIYDR